MSTVSAAAIERSYGPESGWATNPELARLVDPGAFARVKGLLDDAVQRGAKVVVGGQRQPTERYLAPTVLVDVPADAPVLQEEIFGPVLPVVTYRTLEDALAYVRSRPKPLALYSSRSPAAPSTRPSPRPPPAESCVNNTLLHLANPGLPFGGVGPSGMGNYHGRAGFRTFSHERAGDAAAGQSDGPVARACRTAAG